LLQYGKVFQTRDRENRFIKSEDNTGDGLKKRVLYRTLYQLMANNKMQAPVLQYIVEKRAGAADQTTHQSE
jgi:hypothetical protein